MNGHAEIKYKVCSKSNLEKINLDKIVTIEKRKKLDLDELQQNSVLNSTSSWIVEYEPPNSDDSLLVFFEYVNSHQGLLSRLKALKNDSPEDFSDHLEPAANSRVLYTRKLNERLAKFVIWNPKDGKDWEPWEPYPNPENYYGQYVKDGSK